jgi:cbb3-type cytochrome oxidase maturation protein
MGILILMIFSSIFLSIIFIILFILSVKNGQFDDIQSSSIRIFL